MSDDLLRSLDGPPEVGRRRPRRHAVIIKHEVGVAAKRDCSPDFTGSNRTFGSISKRDAEGVGDVILSWKQHQPAPARNGRRNWVCENRRAVLARCVGAKEVSMFRKARGATPLRSRSPSPMRGRVAPPHSADGPGTFGAPTERSDRVSDLLCYHFANDWVAEQRLRERRQRERKERRPKHVRSFIHPPKSMASAVTAFRKGGGAPDGTWQDPDPVLFTGRFTLKKFLNVPSRTEHKHPAESPLRTLGRVRPESAPPVASWSAQAKHSF